MNRSPEWIQQKQAKEAYIKGMPVSDFREHIQNKVKNRDQLSTVEVSRYQNESLHENFQTDQKIMDTEGKPSVYIFDTARENPETKKWERTTPNNEEIGKVFDSFFSEKEDNLSDNNELSPFEISTYRKTLESNDPDEVKRADSFFNTLISKSAKDTIKVNGVTFGEFLAQNTSSNVNLEDTNMRRHLLARFLAKEGQTIDVKEVSSVEHKEKPKPINHKKKSSWKPKGKDKVEKKEEPIENKVPEQEIIEEAEYIVEEMSELESRIEDFLRIDPATRVGILQKTLAKKLENNPKLLMIVSNPDKHAPLLKWIANEIETQVNDSNAKLKQFQAILSIAS